MTLTDLGWDESFADAFAPYEKQGLTPFRVSARHRSDYELLDGDGNAVRADSPPDVIAAVGDWVAAELTDGGRGLIRAVLPRRTTFARKDAGLRPDEQIVAANVDTVFLVTALVNDLNPRRLERYLVAAWESGAAPVIVITKTDLAPDEVPDAVAAVSAVAFGVPIHAVSCITGEGLDELAVYLAPGRTVALLGSSGVGKSTLVNRLTGEELLATQETREDGRGRHTTTHRQLVLLPGGGLVLDTPGMREMQLWEDSGGIDQVFSEIAELAAQCRFTDCAHNAEPDCAITAALADGTLPAERWQSYLKLQRELAALERKRDPIARRENRRKWAAIAKDARVRARKR